MSVKISNLTTEQRNDNSMNLDSLSSLEIIKLMNKEDQKVIEGVEKILPEISKMIDEVVKAFNKGGRLIYVGAGTSGRLGVLDAVECPPTFGTKPEMVQGIIAGGKQAIYKAKEGIEDSKSEARKDLKEINLSSDDVLIGLAASGRTPYVIGALEYANELGCTTGAVSCNENSEIGKVCDIKMEAVVGPEILTGSTRLKSGTAQKMILNMISTGSMVGIGKTYENLMIDVVQTNEKLQARAENMVMEVTDTTRQEAKKALKENESSVKLAVFSIKTGLSASDSKEKLMKAKGHLKVALNNFKKEEKNG